MNVGRRSEYNPRKKKTRFIPEGFLPLMSVGGKQEYKKLVELAMKSGLFYSYHGSHESGNGEIVGVAADLMAHQSLDNLNKLGEQLQELHDKAIANTKLCECKRLDGKS